jgi:hypothetical protein
MATNKPTGYIRNDAVRKRTGFAPRCWAKQLPVNPLSPTVMNLHFSTSGPFVLVPAPIPRHFPLSDRLIRVTISSQSRSSLAG